MSESTLAIFQAEMRRLGYKDGADLVIESRWGNNQIARLPELATAVVESKPELIVTATSATTAFFKKATSTIPIVFATAADPVETGLVASLQRPGGNVTGVRVYLADLMPKTAEMAREAFPKARRLALLVHTPDPTHKRALEAFEASVPRFKFEPIVIRLSGARDFDRAFHEIEERKADAVVVTTLAFFNAYRTELSARALKARVPMIGNDLRYADAGMLLTYGTSLRENYRRAARMADKILQGAKPADMPVEQPERFELVVNQRTAKAIGATLAPVTMLRATKVIE